MKENSCNYFRISRRVHLNLTGIYLTKFAEFSQETISAM